MSEQPNHHKFGLRFSKSQARVLDALADRVRQADLAGSDVSTFEQAAMAARLGEPLIVICDEPVEAEQLAGMYAMAGVKRPTVEHLNSAA